ncbi:MAG: hypothetical protein HQL54_11560, partial [Magnetococcales bacterium]|nr:hypothetical protein [Magnetococcales bacterium]
MTISDYSNASHLHANSAIIQQRWPDLWKRLSTPPEWTHQIHLENTPQTTISVDGMRLSSGFNRRQEAHIQAQAIPEDHSEAWVYGVGIGDLIRVLITRETIRKLHVVIINAPLFMSLIQRLDFTDWLHEPRITLEDRTDHGIIP